MNMPVSYRSDCGARYDAIRESMKDVSGKSLLDIGCYNGYFMSRFLQDGGGLTIGLEIDPEQVLQARVYGLDVRTSMDQLISRTSIGSMMPHFDFCLFLDLYFHAKDTIGYIMKCRQISDISFISASGDGRVNNSRLEPILREIFTNVHPIIQTDYAHRMIYRCE